MAVRRKTPNAEQVQIMRQFGWVSPVLTTFRERPLPGSYVPSLLPTFDIFGTSRIGEVQFAEVLGPLAGVEVTHTKVPVDRWRHYLSMEYEHDDVPARQLTPGRVITDPTGFPFAALRDNIDVPRVRPLAIQNIVVPPLGFIACRSNVMAAGTRMTLRVLWIEYPVGESASNLM